jgi:hypothetical protein
MIYLDLGLVEVRKDALDQPGIARSSAERCNTINRLIRSRMAE